LRASILARWVSVRLLSTLKAVQTVLNVPGVMVIGSEVPNLLQPDAASTLVVSQDVAIGAPIRHLDDVKAAPTRRRFFRTRGVRFFVPFRQSDSSVGEGRRRHS